MTQTTTLTPAPWTVNPFTADYQVISTDAPDKQEERTAALKALGKDQFKALSVGTPRGQVAIIPLDESNNANAMLISTSLELLEVAEDLESWNAKSTAATAEEVLAELGPILRKARAAIAKATKA